MFHLFAISFPLDFLLLYSLLHFSAHFTVFPFLIHEYSFTHFILTENLSRTLEKFTIICQNVFHIKTIPNLHVMELPTSRSSTMLNISYSFHVFFKATDKTFLEKLMNTHMGKHPSFGKPKQAKKGKPESHFELHHYAGELRKKVFMVRRQRAGTHELAGF